MAISLDKARALYDLYCNSLVTLGTPTDFEARPREERVAIGLGIHNGRGGDRIFWNQQDFLNELGDRMGDPSSFPTFPD